MYIAFYKNSKSLFSSFIRFKQRHLSKIPTRYAKFSHVELLFSDGLSFSSSEQDNGVRFKQIEFDKDRWEFVEIKLTPEQEAVVRLFCTKNVSNAYNWWGIFFAMGLNFYSNKSGDYFCSQICVSALQEIGMCCKLSSLFATPGDFAQYMEDRGYILTEKPF